MVNGSASLGTLQQQAMVPMIAPDGSTGMVPQERVHDAVQAGGKIAAQMIAPDGSAGIVPIDRVHEAIQAGGRLGTPGPESHPWSTLGSTIAGGVKGIGSAAVGGLKALAGDPSAQAGIMQNVDQIIQDDAARKQAGRSGAYRAAAAVGQAAGISNPTQQEQAASEGRTGDVAAQAAGEAALPLGIEAARVGVPRVARSIAEDVKPGLPTSPVETPAALRSADELVGTTPERIAELKDVPQQMADIHKLAVDTEAAARAKAKAAYPDIKAPVIRESVVPIEKIITLTDEAPKTRVVREELPFKQVQDEYSELGHDIADEKRAVMAGKPRVELKQMQAKYARLGDELRDAAARDGKLQQFNAAQAGWQRFMDDFHNENSPVRALLKASPDQTTRISNHILSPDNGKRFISTIERNGGDVSGVRSVLQQGRAPLRTNVAESAELEKQGEAAGYKVQRLHEGQHQATTNQLPTGPGAKLPAAAMRSSAPGFLREVPGADAVASPRAITKMKLSRELKKSLGGK